MISKTKHSNILIPVIDSTVITRDITILNLCNDTYDITLNADIYGTDFPLCTDRLQATVHKQKSKQANLLLREKHPRQDTSTSFPKIAYNASTNYFNTQLAEVKESKPRQAKKRYRTIVRRKSRHGKTLKKRYRIDHKDLMLLSVYKPKSRAVVRKKDTTYLQIDRFRKVTDYLESITLNFLYNEKIKTIVTCKLCGVKNSLLSYDNSLGCRKCSRVGYNVRQYRIRYYYFSNYVRYELNELTGKVKKQIETNNGYKTVFTGKITK
jgi:hypothetical protein